MHRRRGGEDGIYRCEIPDSMNVTQTIFIGVYTASSGELYSNWYCIGQYLMCNNTTLHTDGWRLAGLT